MTTGGQTIPPTRQSTSTMTLCDRTRRIGIEIDDQSGLPVALIDQSSAAGQRVPLALSIRLDTEGREVDREPFGLTYEDVVVLSDIRRSAAPVLHDDDGQEELFVVPAEVGPWRIDLEYRFRVAAPRIEVGLVVSQGPDETVSTLRNLYLTWDFAPRDLAAWRLFAPTSSLRPGVSVTDITNEVTTGDADFGGSGMVVVDAPDSQTAVLLWPLCRTEQSVNTIQLEGGHASLRTETKLAGRLREGQRLRWTGYNLDVFDRTWEALRPEIQSWYQPLGIAAPNDMAGWIPGVSLFEVQIGTSVFYGGWEYSPYPTARDLHEDVGRIAGLGFDCIQIMPRQPFPSYNVYDYDDITLSYGDEDDIRRVVEAAHAHGMHVILDILMHGVIDETMIKRTADRVRNGPYFPRFDEGTEIEPNEDSTAYEGFDYLLGWARHIIDFEPYWAQGSPGDHPMAADHPDWFVRDSTGEIIGVYTKAFDNNNVAWQEYFTGVCLMLIERLGVDGFRFDAPTYNEVPNWSAATERRASASQLGSVEHFARLRGALKSRYPEVMLYTEPAGVLFRQTMDIVYNYDEQSLIPSVIRPDSESSPISQNPESADDLPEVGVRTGRDLAAWFQNKAATLPKGSMTARHIDSHDSFWWPLPGFKWRREQYGIPATRALVATWSLSGGAYMMFVGGEMGIEEDTRRINRLRHTIPEIRTGAADYDGVIVEDEHIYAVARILDGQRTLVLVNLSGEPISTSASLVGVDDLDSPAGYVLHDVWRDESLANAAGYRWGSADLEAIDLTFAPYQAMVLTIRPPD